jgi:hypothetical protein
MTTPRSRVILRKLLQWAPIHHRFAYTLKCEQLVVECGKLEYARFATCCITLRGIVIIIIMDTIVIIHKFVIQIIYKVRYVVFYLPHVIYNNYSFIVVSILLCVVGIATGYGLDDRRVGVRVPVGSRIFSSPCRADRFWGPPSLLSNRYRGSFPGIKRPGREANHSPPASAEVKKIWIYTAVTPYAFMM